jgi:hypothetical protein
MKYWRAICLIQNLKVLRSHKRYEEARHGSYLNKGAFGRFIKTIKITKLP